MNVIEYLTSNIFSPVFSVITRSKKQDERSDHIFVGISFYDKKNFPKRLVGLFIGPSRRASPWDLWVRAMRCITICWRYMHLGCGPFGPLPGCRAICWKTWQNTGITFVECQAKCGM